MEYFNTPVNSESSIHNMGFGVLFVIIYLKTILGDIHRKKAIKILINPNKKAPYAKPSRRGIKLYPMAKNPPIKKSQNTQMGKINILTISL
jgi:hypothetical protein